MAVDPKRAKALQIKTGVCKRLAKEKEYYIKEATQLKDKVEKMKAAGKDEYDIKKQGEVLQESEMMIPDCERKLASAWDELSKLIETEVDLSESTEYKAAAQILKDTKEAAKR